MESSSLGSKIKRQERIQLVVETNRGQPQTHLSEKVDEDSGDETTHSLIDAFSPALDKGN